MPFFFHFVLRLYRLLFTDLAPFFVVFHIFTLSIMYCLQLFHSVLLYISLYLFHYVTLFAMLYLYIPLLLHSSYSLAFTQHTMTCYTTYNIRVLFQPNVFSQTLFPLSKSYFHVLYCIFFAGLQGTQTTSYQHIFLCFTQRSMHYLPLMLGQHPIPCILELLSFATVLMA